MKKLTPHKDSEDIFGVLYETGKLINSTLDIATILKNIVEIMSVHFRSGDFSFLALEGERLLLKAALNHPRWGDSNYFIPLGKGITGTVAATGQPLNIGDVRKDKRYIGIRPKMLSELAVPVKIDGKVVGVFNLESPDINSFKEQDLKLLTALADQTAVAIKNARLYKSYADNVKRLSNLYESGKAINSSLHIGGILKALLETSSKELNYDSIAILLISNGRLYARAGLGFTSDEIASYSAAMGEGVCGKVAETGKPLIVSDVSKCDFYIEQSSRTKSEMAIPIKYGGKVMGVYNVESNNLNSFDNDDLLFISALSEQAAIAIKNAELFKEIESFSEVLQKKVNEATTELKNANEELQYLNKVKTDFLSIVSHELRTPMTSIVGYVSLLRDGECGPINQQQKEFLQIVQDESMRLYRLLSDLLDVQKIEAKRMIYIFKDFDFMGFLKKYSKEAERECKAKGLDFSLILPKNIPIIKADEDKIRQIMTNLVSNALKFTKKGGIKIELHVLPEFLQIEVSDTGIGISEANQKLLFEKFSQVNMEASREAGGTGLGLAITKSLVEAHGGKIWMESKPGHGSKFVFTMSRKLGNNLV
ncbi:GAF domain-containing protein [Candidatus Woesearchaeota archaeon]|nr:GAF domain-containing protein [Candidatus Woesearchaeota archaeon]